MSAMSMVGPKKASASSPTCINNISHYNHRYCPLFTIRFLSGSMIPELIGPCEEYNQKLQFCSQLMSSPKKHSMRLESIKQPLSVKVLILSQNKTTLKQFYFMQAYSNLVKIDLSYNKLTSFPQGFTFASFRQLRTLFLHYNKFSALKNLVPVTESKTIYYLTLFGNPLEEAKARHLCVNQMTRLMLMDDKVVNSEERSQLLDATEKTNKVLSFPLVGAKSEGKEQSTAQYLSNVIRQLAIVRRHYLESNPVIKIQRWWRHHLRLKDTKWKIVELPPQEKMQSIMSNLQRSRTELDRLITQRMEITRSREQVIYSLLVANWEFWVSIKRILSQGQLYLSREYCKLNAIDYQQIQTLKVIRHFGHIPMSELRNKKLLAFFLHYHKKIIIRSKIQGKVEWKKVDKFQLKTLAKKLEVNPQKTIAVDNKLQVLQENYQYYVRPKISFASLFTILKKQYYVYQKALILNFEPDPFPFLSQALLKRTKAVVQIQRRWRGHRTRKQIDARVRIRQEKAAIRLQRWVRNLKFHHRYKFLLQVSVYLKKERKSNEITLELLQIPAIEKYCTFKEQSGINFMICFQQNSFSISKTASLSYYNNIHRSKIVFFAERRPDPEYLDLTFTTDTSKQPTTLKPTSTILQILFKNAKSFEKATDSKGTKYIRFTYQSVEETLNRKFILALKTYRMPNHQFIRSMLWPSVPAQYITNLVNVINENRLITVTDADSRIMKEGNSEHGPGALQSQKSLTTMNSAANIVDDVLYLKIRFFVGKMDYSCQLALKSPNYTKKKVIKDTSLNSVREEYCLGRKKSASRRYEEEHTDQFSKISRKIISLNKLQGSQPNSSRKNSIAYPKILNTDQSHSVIESLSPKNSYSKLTQKIELYDKFDKEVYPAPTQYLRQSLRYKRHLDQIHEMRHKRSLIEQVKSSHKEKISEIAGRREQQLNSLKQMKNREQMEYSMQISKLKEEIEKEKIKKHDRVKKRMNSKTDNFESDFVKKGIKSINKEMRDFQKKSRSYRDYKILESKIQRDSIKESPRQVQKTQIKEFSINFSDNDFSLKITDHQRDAEKVELQKELLSNTKHLRSNISQEKEKSLESEPNELAKHLKSEIREAQGDYESRKRLKKKKMVHSVFPEEFYPLKQSKQIGFELPRLSKN